MFFVKATTLMPNLSLIFPCDLFSSATNKTLARLISLAQAWPLSISSFSLFCSSAVSLTGCLSSGIASFPSFNEAYHILPPINRFKLDGV
jgi:hypothetical protein